TVIRIGLDARTLERREEIRGIGVLVAALVERLPAADADFVLFFRRHPDCPPPHSARSMVLRIRPDRPRWIARVLWEQVVLPRALHQEGLDLYHAPANRGVPRAAPVPCVVTINDVIPLVTPYLFDSRPDPRWTRPLLRRAYAALVGAGVRRAARIITLSECSRRDLERLFPLARGKVRVIYPGCDERYRPVEDPQELARVRARWALPPRFVVYVGGLGQRKNLAGLLRAYAELVGAAPATPPLIVVGAATAFLPRLQAQAQQLGIAERVRFPGYIPTAEMPAVLSAAELLVYPSFYEGFGLPVLEAMACGCPVVCSGTSSLPEVGGDAVVYVDPADPGDIAGAMGRVLADGALRAWMREAGLQRARLFPLRRMVEETLAVYREVVGDRRVRAVSAPVPQGSPGSAAPTTRS
ncbi:MAG TPA: glycosyltransferase family 1 protein, partial [bacterium]|nr:glycosyltransferase family 1 protein [bacterium]